MVLGHILEVVLLAGINENWGKTEVLLNKETTC
jgi:hypothetical protein